MTHRCPRLVIAATGSGVGKTSLALGLTRALAARGLTVQTFKVGPDFLDPSYLTLAAGKACYNIDSWMTSGPYVADLFARATGEADIAVIEGVMGLFDGASATTLDGSTAEIARLLDAPVLLVVNAHGAARSLAATVKGFATFEPGIHVAGVIANHCGSDRHRTTLSESLAAASLPPLVGAVPRNALPTLQSRHLGLTTADAATLPAATLDALAAACETHLDIDAILALAGATSKVGDAHAGALQTTQSFGMAPKRFGMAPKHLGMAPGRGGAPVRIGIARDEAFHFYYPDNLEALEVAGAELVPFSPLRDRELPQGLSGIYLGGGYPEIHAAALAANAPMRDAVARFAASGRCVYAECGGLMYLGRCVRTIGGETFPLAGVLPIDTAMLPRLKTLGYVEAALAADAAIGPTGVKVRGHEFHYSEITRDDSAAGGFQPLYSLTRRRGGGPQQEGFLRGNVIASYVHLHFASHPHIAGAFVQRCKEHS